MKKLLPLLLLTLFLFSCEKIQKVEDFPLHKSKLVVNCMFRNDSIFVFEFSKSLSPIDNAPMRNFLNASAYVVLYENNVLFDTVRYDPNEKNYRSSRKATTGKTYTFRSYFPGYPECTGTEILPQKGSMSNIEVQRTINAAEDWGTGSYYLDALEKFQFDLSDDPNARDYYILTIHREIDSSYDVYANSTEELNGLCDMEYLNEFVFITEMDNSNTLGRIFLSTQLYISGSASNDPKIDYWIEIQKCGENAFKYMRSLQKQYYNSGDPFAEPSPVWNNISNGYGIFGGVAIHRFSFTK